MRRQIQDMQDNLSRLENITQAMSSASKTVGKVDAVQILSTMAAIAGNLSDAFDTLEYQTNDLNDRSNAQHGDIDRLNHRSLTLIKDIKDLREGQARLEEKLDNLATIILRSLKDIPVKGAEGDE